MSGLWQQRKREVVMNKRERLAGVAGSGRGRTRRIAGKLLAAALVASAVALPKAAQAQQTWTPTEILQDLGIWFDASDAATIWSDTTASTPATIDGGVARWDDKSTHNRHITQATSGLRPIRRSGFLEFDGVDDILFNTSAFLYANGSNDIYIVAAAGADVGAVMIGEASSANNNPLYTPIYRKPSGDRSIFTYWIRNTENVVLVANTVDMSASGALDIAQVRIYQAADTGNSVTARVNAADPRSQSYTRAGTFTANQFGIGALPPRPNSTAGFGSMRLDLREVVVATKVLSQEEREKVEGYLAHKWSLAAVLPEGHPYKSAPPELRKTGTVISIR
ncbi:MAG: hypothetical protein ACNA71_09450 [Kiritimatiellia bacterium]